MKIYKNPLINAGVRAMTILFLKIASYLDLEFSKLTVELAGDVIIPNIKVIILKSNDKCRH